jgi:hypothetical protein
MASRSETIEQFAARPLLLREMTAFLAQHRQVVEVTRDDLHQCCTSVTLMDSDAEAHAEAINARLRARAVPASDMLVYQEGFRHGKAWMDVPASRPALDVEKVAREIMVTNAATGVTADSLTAILRRHATDTGWVQVPTTQTAGELVVPESGQYVLRRPGAIDVETVWLVAGQPVPFEGVTAIRRIDTDAPTTWITRTPTTSRVWTAESCEQFVGKLCVEQCEGGYSETQRWDVSETPARIAECLNGWNVVSVYILPQDGPR